MYCRPPSAVSCGVHLWGYDPDTSFGAMDGNQHRPDDPFVAFDGHRVPESWLPDLSRTLLELGQAIGPIDRPILALLTESPRVS